jgi:hypothetical protein
MADFFMADQLTSQVTLLSLIKEHLVSLGCAGSHNKVFFSDSTIKAPGVHSVLLHGWYLPDSRIFDLH